MSIDTRRTEYHLDLPFDDPIDPLDQFRRWYALAESSGIIEPNAMALATVSSSGVPAVRMVLLKGIEEGETAGEFGFQFYTNLDSAKAQDLRANPNVGLCFFWDKLHRQIRVVGSIEQLPRATVEQYFLKRPKGAQLAAAVSKQSSKLGSYQQLETEYAELQEQYAHSDCPLPDSWGGFLVRPIEIEFCKAR